MNKYKDTFLSANGLIILLCLMDSGLQTGHKQGGGGGVGRGGRRVEKEENGQFAYVLPGFRVNIRLFDPTGASEYLVSTVSIFCTQHDRLNAWKNHAGVSFLWSWLQCSHQSDRGLAHAGKLCMEGGNELLCQIQTAFLF